jgi:uncharacterized protein (DUF58 family)
MLARRHHLRFTREGKWITILSLAVGLAAINTGNNLLYLLLGWLLSFIIASGVLSESNLRGLRLQRRVPARVHAGKPFLVELTVHNDKATRAAYSFEIEDLVAGVPIDKRCTFFHIPARGSQSASYRHTAPRRGLYRLEGFRVATRFPFGLFRKWRDQPEVTELVVLPALTTVQRPPPRTQIHGESTSARMGRHGEFFGLRERRIGDDRRNIHWRSSARTGRLLVREYEDEFAKAVTLVVDNALPTAARQAIEDGTSSSEAQALLDALERAVSTTASLAVSYLASDWSVAIIARGAHLLPGRGRMHESRALHFLALVPIASDDRPFAAPVPAREDSIMVVPRGIAAAGRPAASSTVEA